MWRGKYNVPTTLGACGPSTSKSIGFQIGYEKGISSILAAVSGASVVNVHGGMHVELTYHPVQSVLDDDILGMVGRYLEGVKVTAETLAVDVIHEVGPIPGFFLSHAHTREWWQREQFLPKVADRLSYTEWCQSGKKSALDYAKERVDEILATHEPTPPLPPGVEQELDSILGEAEAYYKRKGFL